MNLNNTYTNREDLHLTPIMPGYNPRETVENPFSVFSERTHIINGTHKDLIITLRNNVRYKCESIVNDPRLLNGVSNYLNKITVRKEYTFKPNFNGFNEWYAYFSSIVNNPEIDPKSELKVIASTYLSNHNSFSPRGKQILVVIDHIILEEDIRSINYNFYVPTVDIVISDTSLADSVLHPFNSNTVIKEVYDELTAKGAMSTVGYEIVSNNENLKFFVNIGIDREILMINSHRSTVKEDGIYIVVYNKDNIGRPKKILKRYELSEAETIGVYRTEEAAYSGGDVKSIRLEEIAKLNHELTLITNQAKQVEQQNKLELEELKRKVDIDKINYEREKAEHDKQVLKLQNELLREKDYYERKSKERNDIYEEKNSKRKDNTEMLKTIATGVTLIISLIAIIKSNSGQSK